MPKRCLIVVSTYFPAIAADMHRARLLASELPKCGYEVEILTPDKGYQRVDSIDEESAPLFYDEVTVHEVSPWMPGLFKALDITTIGWRAYQPLKKRGLELLKTGRFDIVYFSTTQFVLFGLGPAWQKQTNIPYVLDVHDPWYLPERKFNTSRKRLKSKIAARMTKLQERNAFSKATGIVSVSPKYLDMLNDRYSDDSFPWCKRLRQIVSPFAASRRDFDAVHCDITREDDGVRHIAYVGAGGELMLKSFMQVMLFLMSALREQPELRGKVKLTLHGTDGDWKPGDGLFLQHISDKHGLEGVIEERPQRIPYREATRIATKADGLIVFGVDDPAYMPSKLFTYSISGKPMLACLHEDTIARALFEDKPKIGHLVTFNIPDTTSEKIVSQDTNAGYATFKTFLDEVIHKRSFEREEALANHLAPAMARKHTEFFDRCLSNADT